jgi:hypothetical protein
MRFSNWPNVRHIELGWKERRGRVTRTLCVKLHVTEKTNAIATHERLPKSTRILVPTSKGRYIARRVLTDVVWHAPARLVGTTDFVNPIRAGALIGIPGGEVGTYAGVVRDSSGRLFHLTAGHVVQPFPGDVGVLPILQPPVQSPTIPPNATVEIGQTAGGFVGNRSSGFVDFALIDTTASRPGTSQALDGRLTVPAVLPSNVVAGRPTPVTKFGATTLRTHAVFAGFTQSIVADGLFMTNVMTFRGTDTTVFADRGDSGALVVSDDESTSGMVVGILVGVIEPTPDAPAGRGLVVPFERLPVRPV